MRIRACLGFLAMVCVAAPAWADQVILFDGTAHTNVNITEATYEKVTFKIPNVRKAQEAMVREEPPQWILVIRVYGDNKIDTSGYNTRVRACATQ